MKYNDHIHSDSKNWRGFRYAPSATLLTAGDVRRYVFIGMKSGA
jgi:hypothetical protein